MATLREFYDTDFSRVLHVTNVRRVESRGETMEVSARVHLDFDANARYVSCFLPDTASNGDACKTLVDGLESLLAIGGGVEVKSGFRGEAPRSSLELQFAGRLFIYHERELGEDVQQQLTEYARSRHVFLQFRGPTFAAERTKFEKPLALHFPRFA